VRTEADVGHVGKNLVIASMVEDVVMAEETHVTAIGASRRTAIATEIATMIPGAVNAEAGTIPR
jgi:hypothetical protein